MTARQGITVISIGGSVFLIVLSFFQPQTLWLLALFAMIIALGVYDILQRKRTVLRLYPVAKILKS